MIRNIGFLLMIVMTSAVSAFGQAISVSDGQYHLYGPNSTWGEYLLVGGNGLVAPYASVFATNGNLHLDSKAGFATFINHYNQGKTFINPNGGLVGIGTIEPTEQVDVKLNMRADRFRTGNAVFYTNSRSSFNSFNSGTDQGLNIGWIAADFGGVDNASDRLVVGSGYGGKVVIGSHNANLSDWGGDLLISPYKGNVGIGTSAPQEKLSVKGNIRAKEIKVEANNWPDFVFEKSYQLPGLAETEKYIRKEGHLPGIPSAAEVNADGISLGEMNVKLLQKVEELTLYLIQQNKILEAQKEKLEAQQINLEKQQKDINSLKERKYEDKK